MTLHFRIRSARAVSVDSVKGLRQPTDLPNENVRPPIPTRCIFMVLPSENDGVS